jgi:DNA-binding LacI/PurR family transcriptional regulator
MSQVAKRAGVSVMTVSYAYSRPERVSAESREKVARAAAELGYSGPDPAARSLRYGTTRTIGVIFGEHLTYAFDNPQAVAFLAGIAEVCAERGYGMLIVPISDTDDNARRVAASAVDAFIIWTTSDDDPVLDAVSSTGRTAVIHGGPARAGLLPVGIDDRAAAFEMGRRTFAGAARPAVLSFPLDRQRATLVTPGIDPDSALFPVTRQRLLGFRDAAESLGFDWRHVLVGVAATNDEGEAEGVALSMLAAGSRVDASRGDVSRGDVSRVDVPRVDAIAAMSDVQAVGVLGAASALKLDVPRQLSVSGWDDSNDATAHALSSVAQDLRAQGAAAARLALGGRADPAQWSVVVRASTR